MIYIDNCSWDNPGINPYTGTVVEAVSHYNLNKEAKEEILLKLSHHSFDDSVIIDKDSIEGSKSYTNVREMHFGANKICHSVSRTKWKGRQERGLVYCSGDQCIIIPSVCGNVSRVDRAVRSSAMSSSNSGYAAYTPAPSTPPPSVYWPIQPIPSLITQQDNRNWNSPIVENYEVSPTIVFAQKIDCIIPAVPEPSTRFLFTISIFVCALYGAYRAYKNR
jgi:hypothetical protein